MQDSSTSYVDKSMGYEVENLLKIEAISMGYDIDDFGPAGPRQEG
jgi:hypothetical protein